ncbi:MAG: hypothetical protein WCK33_09230 [Phycisphaerae bacterium]
MATPPPPRRPFPVAAPPGAALADFTSGLVWPRLLQAPLLAARFTPVLMGVMAVGTLRLLDLLGGERPVVGATLNAIAAAFGHLVDAAMSFDGLGVHVAASDILLRLPLAELQGRPWLAGFVLFVSLALAAAFGGAIARQAALHCGGHRVLSPLGILLEAVGRLHSSAIAFVLPTLILGASLLLIGCLGWLLLSIPYVQVAGAALMGLAVPLAFVAVFLGFAALLGTALMIPCVAAEGTDALDAIQRVLAYSRGAFVRLAFYVAVSVAVGLLASRLVFAIGGSASAIFDDMSRAFLREKTAAALASPSSDHPWSILATRAILEFWSGVPRLLAQAYAFSLFFTASTLVYLGMRRAVDGQDMGEIWVPVPGQATRPPEAAPSRDEEAL